MDAVVTDPPYELGFMGKSWDAAGVSFRRETWAAVLRVLKPGGHLLAFGGSRTFHRIACAIEDAGFEIRDTLSWLYGSGFPKSLDVSKALDKAGGRNWAALAAELRGAISAAGLSAADIAKQLGWPSASSVSDYVNGGHVPPPARQEQLATLLAGFEASGVWRGKAGEVLSGNMAMSAANYARSEKGAPVSDAARQWEGWGTALKPAWEPIILARKPLMGTVAANVQAWGTGALNIDGCRIATTENLNGGAYATETSKGHSGSLEGGVLGVTGREYAQPLGRWPANVVLDEEAAAALDAQTGVLKSGSGQKNTRRSTGEIFRAAAGSADDTQYTGDSGGASRFFYVAKASRSERDAGCESLPVRSGGEATDREDGSAGLNNPRAGAGRTGGARNIHPTVKPVALMRWLVRLVTPPAGLVLDPFAGSGTTGVAALQEGFQFVGVEQSGEYVEIARHRLAHAEKPAAKYRAAVARAKDAEGIGRAVAAADGLRDIATGGIAMEHYAPLGRAAVHHVLGLDAPTTGPEPECLGCDVDTGDVLLHEMRQAQSQPRSRPGESKPPRSLPDNTCHADSDGDCTWEKCPQNNPATRVSWCPLASKPAEDES